MEAETLVLIVCGVGIAIVVGHAIYEIRTTVGNSYPPHRKPFFSKKKGKHK